MKVEQQLDHIQKAGVADNWIFVDAPQAGLVRQHEFVELVQRDLLFRSLVQGDILVVSAIDRLGKNLADVMDHVAEALRKGVKIYECEIQTEHEWGEQVATLCESIARTENKLMVERGRNYYGLKGPNAKKTLKVGPRPSLKGDKLNKAKKLWEGREFSGGIIAKKTGVSLRTLYRTFGPRVVAQEKMKDLVIETAKSAVDIDRSDLIAWNKKKRMIRHAQKVHENERRLQKERDERQGGEEESGEAVQRDT
jgi:DNA invertase Pin-like site-specific DNA recombinase